MIFINVPLLRSVTLFPFTHHSESSSISFPAMQSPLFACGNRRVVFVFNTDVTFVPSVIHFTVTAIDLFAIDYFHAVVIFFGLPSAMSRVRPLGNIFGFKCSRLEQPGVEYSILNPVFNYLQRGTVMFFRAHR